MSFFRSLESNQMLTTIQTVLILENLDNLPKISNLHSDLTHPIAVPSTQLCGSLKTKGRQP